MNKPVHQLHTDQGTQMRSLCEGHYLDYRSNSRYDTTNAFIDRFRDKWRYFTGTPLQSLNRQIKFWYISIVYLPEYKWYDNVNIYFTDILLGRECKLKLIIGKRFGGQYLELFICFFIILVT